MDTIKAMETYGIGCEPKYGFPGEWVATHGETEDTIIIEYGNSVADAVRAVVAKIGEVNRNRSGMLYGRMSVRYKSGPRKGKVRKVGAHRMSVQVFHQGKRITPKTVIMHLCNNSLCINPAHLIGGTQSKNVRQCVKDGRHKTPFRREVAAV